VVALRLILKTPFAVGVPASDAVPFPLLRNEMPDGRAPASDRVTAGKPADDIVKEPAVPTRNVALFTLVIAGTWFTVMVNVWGVATPEVLLAFRPMASERLFQRKVAHYAQAHPRRVAIRIRNRPSPT
jgi:hypothetical protein